MLHTHTHTHTHTHARARMHAWFKKKKCGWYSPWRKHYQQAVVAYAFNPCTWEAEAGGSLSSRPAWSTEWVPGQPRLHRETLSQKKKKKFGNYKSKPNQNPFFQKQVVIFVFCKFGLYSVVLNSNNNKKLSFQIWWLYWDGFQVKYPLQMQTTKYNSTTRHEKPSHGLLARDGQETSKHIDDHYWLLFASRGRR